MNYDECLAYLDRVGSEVLTMKFGLETTRELLKFLGDPHLEYASILIAGTNGKGSVACFLDSVCVTSGIRSGVYTSPHLIKPEERIVVDGLPVTSQVFANCITRVAEAVNCLQLPSNPTYFEILTILEVGMGGRLDSTNVVNPVLSILTPVGLDHQIFLGNSLEAVATEKAGILHETGLALMGRQRSEVRRVFVREATRKRVKLLQLDSSDIQYKSSTAGKYTFEFHGTEYALSMCGCHQIENASLAIQAFELLSSCGISVSKASLTQGIEKACCDGRIQILSHDPIIVLDGAHNSDAVNNLVRFLTEHTQEPRTLIFSMMKDKDMTPVGELVMACFQDIYLTSMSSDRVASIREMNGLFPSGIPVADPSVAYSRALNTSAKTVVVAGSFYLVGEILKNFE